MTKETERQTMTDEELPQDLDELLRRTEAAQPDKQVGESAVDGQEPAESIDEQHESVGHADAESTAKPKKLMWKTILVGDILTHQFFRRQVKLLVLLVLFAIVYISNRYNVQQQLIEINRLEKELTDIKYDALTRSSELTEKSRQSHIEDYISQEESELRTSSNPPYLIK